MYSLRQYLLTLENSFGLTRTLGEVELCRDEEGKVLFSSGNSAIVFRIRHEGKVKALRCYRHPTKHLRTIYGERLLEAELFLYDTPRTGRWVDVVLTDWIEGETLHHHLETAAAAGDKAHFQRLAEAFDRLAVRLLTDDWAHGDLKPDNLIVDVRGEMHPIDFDGAFLPEMRNRTASELGTAAFQHPRRTEAIFDERLDDFSIALLSTALHALTLDPTLYQRYGDRDGLLFEGHHLAEDTAWNEVVEGFAAAGDALRYRIAREMLHPLVQNPDLARFFALTQPESEVPPTAAETATPEAEVDALYWGFRLGERWVIPPLYDEAFDFREGLALVRLGAHWHAIDRTGHCRLHLPPCDQVKPFRNGRALLYRDGACIAIGLNGEVLDI